MFKLLYILSKYVRLLSGWNDRRFYNGLVVLDFRVKVLKKLCYRHYEIVIRDYGVNVNIVDRRDFRSYYICFGSVCFYIEDRQFGRI